jgi:hypothetical protein
MATEDKIDLLLLKKLGGTGVRFFAILLDLSKVLSPPAWIEVRDHLGRGAVLVGDEALGQGPEAQEVVSMIHQDLATGECPSMVCPIACAPVASSAVVAAVEGPAEELALHAERGTGKTIVTIVIMLILA